MDQWCASALSQSFPALFEVAINKLETVVEEWDQSVGNGSWKLNFLRPFDYWELDLVRNLLNAMQKERVSSKLDRISWKEAGGDSFSVREAYRVLNPKTTSLIFVKGIWVPCAPTKSAFYAWEAAWGKVLTLDKLQRRG